MRLLTLASLIALPLTALACGDDDSSSPNGATGAAGAAGGAGSAQGDPRAQVAAMAREDLACASSEECCVVTDGCRATAYVVAASDRATAEALLASAPNDACVKCIAPALDVACVGGKCVGAEVPPANASTAVRQNHCGAPVGGAGGAPVHKLGCGG